jgi:hypothetical protein
MQKKVLLSIDKASWTTASPAFRHPYPSTFPSSADTSIDFLASLLQVGTLTVPTRGAGCSLAAYWAYVRYCAAIDFTSPFLRLVEEWSDLDSHQKTILSDDWGVGFTTHWLASRLGYRSYCDGRYFIQRLKGLGIAKVNKTPNKRGPYKCPDFIFEDGNGLFHVVECKGNQQGEVFLNSQLSDGLVQKQSIIFANEQSQVGQRLVAGLFAAESSSEETSRLAIRDPEPRGLVVTIRDDVRPDEIRDIIHREDLARQIILLGGSEIAAQLLEMPTKDSIVHSHRKRLFAEAIRNLLSGLDRQVDGQWLARSATLPFPQVIKSDNRTFRSVTVTHRVHEDFLKRLSVYDPTGSTLSSQFPEGELFEMGWDSREREYSASLHRGQHLVSIISLNE